MGRELLLSVTLDDCEVQSFRPGGAGGQHRDKTSNAVRIIHHPSGSVGQSSESRSWTENRETAFKKMARHWKFKLWIDCLFAKELPVRQPDRRYTYKHPISIETRKMKEE